MVAYLVLLVLLAALFLSPVAIGRWRRYRTELECGAPADSVRAKRAMAAKPTARRSDYRAASVRPCENACAAALAAQSQRILSEEVPHLPLETCDRIRECSCTYEQHADRRSGDDRRNTYGSLSKVGAIGHQGINSRSGLDRRADADSEFDGIEFE